MLRRWRFVLLPLFGILVTGIAVWVWRADLQERDDLKSKLVERYQTEHPEFRIEIEYRGKSEGWYLFEARVYRHVDGDDPWLLENKRCHAVMYREGRRFFFESLCGSWSADCATYLPGYRQPRNQPQ